MNCPKCNSTNPSTAATCRDCGASLDLATMETGVIGRGFSVPGPAPSVGAQRALQAGDVLASRYEILKELGKGGMGAVFKARDQELDRLVAIKVVRPDLAANPEILHRFKQELILARKVTHKNVVRIFDIGLSEALRFITMEYVEGRDLKQILAERQKLPPEEAASIIIQICQALDAAHSEGIIHRDLKPPNIMIDAQGKILVMDFGIARSLEATGGTQTGTLLGTPEYMSPEQAKGEKVDPRSDLFTLGIIFYELLTGKSPYVADTAIATILKRIQERAIPPAEVDAAVPQELSGFVVKCLEVNRDERYQSAKDLLRDLENWLNPPQATIIGGPSAAAVPARNYWKWAAAALGVMILAVVGILLLRKPVGSGPAANLEPVTLLVADFDNNTQDQVFDGALESAFTLAMEGASFITSYRRGDARKIAGQLVAGSTRLDEKTAILVAKREGIRVIVAGSIGRQGNGYSVSVRAVAASDEKQIAASQKNAGSKEDVLNQVGKLATELRKSLGDVKADATQAASVEAFSAASIEAAHEYSKAQELQWAGKAEDAAQAYKKAIDLDANLGRAYAGLAAVSSNLGRAQEAKKYYEQAMAHLDRMSEREKGRTMGGYYLSVRNAEKAIEVLSEVVQKYPADPSGVSNLAYAYSLRRDLPRALEVGRKAVAIYPKNLIQRNNVAIYAMYAGDFEAAEKEARSVLEANPAFLKAYVVIALSELAQGRVEQAVAEYHKLEKVSPVGVSFSAIGLADIALFEGRAAEAIQILEKQIPVDLEAKTNGPAAVKLAALAYAQLQSGDKGKATASAEKAQALSQSETLAFEVGRIFVEAGQDAKARAIAANLSSQVLPEPQAYGKLIEAELSLKRGNAREAAKLILEAKKLVDTWIGRLILGRAYLEDKTFTEANSELEACVKRHGEATALFLDEVPTYRSFPPVYYFLGRARDGLKSPNAAESYRTFLKLRKSASTDPLVLDTQRLLAGR